MDETAYKLTYTNYNHSPCLFAKALLCRCAACSKAQKLNIAEREAMACLSPEAHARCAAFLELLHEKALFALRLTHLDGPLPHGKEIKVQCGGLQGLQAILKQETEVFVSDINALLSQAEGMTGGLATLPYQEIVKLIVAYTQRKRGGKSS